jgi:hypothetical protein
VTAARANQSKIVFSTGETNDDDVDPDAEGETDEEYAQAESGTGYAVSGLKRTRKPRGSSKSSSSVMPAEKRVKTVESFKAAGAR